MWRYYLFDITEISEIKTGIIFLWWRRRKGAVFRNGGPAKEALFSSIDVRCIQGVIHHRCDNSVLQARRTNVDLLQCILNTFFSFFLKKKQKKTLSSLTHREKVSRHGKGDGTHPHTLSTLFFFFFYGNFRPSLHRKKKLKFWLP